MIERTDTFDHWLQLIPEGELLDCFGGFIATDRLCQKYCAMRLRCAIEKTQALRMEMLENLVADPEHPLTPH